MYIYIYIYIYVYINIYQLINKINKTELNVILSRINRRTIYYVEFHVSFMIFK